MLLIPLAPLPYPLPFLIVAIGVCFASVPIVCSPIRSLQVMPEPEELPAITVPFAAPTDA